MSRILRVLGQHLDPVTPLSVLSRLSVCTGRKLKCIERVRIRQVFFLSPPHSLSSGYGGRKWRLYVERSFEFTEKEIRRWQSATPSRLFCSDGWVEQTNSHLKTRSDYKESERYKTLFRSSDLTVFTGTTRTTKKWGDSGRNSGWGSGKMKLQLDATLCRFYFCRVTLHDSGASAHHQEYLKLVQRPLVHVLSLQVSHHISMLMYAGVSCLCLHILLYQMAAFVLYSFLLMFL